MIPLAPVEIAARAAGKGRISFAFGKRFLVLFGVGVLWLALPRWGVVSMCVWDLMLLGLWIVDAGQLPRPRELEARRRWKSALSIGLPAHVEVSLANHSPQAINAWMLDEVPHVLRVTPPEFTMNDAGYEVLPRERGDIAVGRLFIRYQSPWRLAQRWAVANLSQTVRVLPDMEQARALSLYRLRSRQVEIRKRQRRQRGQGRDFESLRDYRQGDEMRDISWTSTARRHQLTTRAYQAERSQTVWIVMDAGRLLRAKVNDAARGFPATKLDYAVDAALSLAQVVSQSGDKVGVLAYGRGVQLLSAPARGAQHLRLLVERLAHVHEEAAEGNHANAVRVLLQKQSRRALIVWMTDFAETATIPEVIEYAAHMRRKHLVVFAAMGQPDLLAISRATPASKDEMFRHAAALEIVERRERFLRTMRGQGVMALDVDAPALAASLVNQYLEVKERNAL